VPGAKPGTVDRERLQTQAVPSKSCGFMLRAVPTPARVNQDTAWTALPQYRSLARPPPPPPRRHSQDWRHARLAAGRIWLACLAWAGVGAKEWQQDEITFLLRDLEECGSNRPPRRQATSPVTGSSPPTTARNHKSVGFDRSGHSRTRSPTQVPPGSDMPWRTARTGRGSSSKSFL